MRTNMKIGEVAERTGLSLRTIRYYEEVGLVVPASRTHGGFRLYSDADVARFEVIKRMKPLGFSLEEMRDLLSVLHELDVPGLAPDAREWLVDRLRMYRAAADERCRTLSEQLATAQDFSASLLGSIRSHERAPDHAP